MIVLPVLNSHPCTACTADSDWCPHCGGRLGLAPHIGVAKARGSWWAESVARKCVGPLPLWPGWTETVREIALRKVEGLSDHEVAIEGLARVCAEAAAMEWEVLRGNPEWLSMVRTSARGTT